MSGKRNRAWNEAIICASAVMALAACTTGQSDDAGLAAANTANTASSTVPGGVVREGSTIASMADQYSHPRSGPTSAAGASAWVAPSPPPAFVLSGPLPPADPPAPMPAAVANRQPATPAPAASAADLVRPEAAAPDAPAAAPARDPAVRTAGLKLFNDYSCSACHSLADAGASGSIGPSLDRNTRLSKASLVDVLTNGRGAMPAFSGQMSDAEIGTLADYILQYSRK